MGRPIEDFPFKALDIEFDEVRDGHFVLGDEVVDGDDGDGALLALGGEVGLGRGEERGAGEIGPEGEGELAGGSGGASLEPVGVGEVLGELGEEAAHFFLGFDEVVGSVGEDVSGHTAPFTGIGTDIEDGLGVEAEFMEAGEEAAGLAVLPAEAAEEPVGEAAEAWVLDEEEVDAGA